MRLFSYPALHGGEPEVRSQPLRPRTIVLLAPLLLDVVIIAYTIAVLLILLTGGIVLGPLSLTDTAKPLLVLAIAVPVRLSLSGPSWLAERVSHLKGGMAAIWTRFSETQLGPAIIDVGLVLVVTRVATFTVGFMANLVLQPAKVRDLALPFESTKFAEIFVAWDSGWYFDIARRGYYYSTDGQSSVAFFPLYPMLMRAVAWPFGGTDRSLWAAGIIVSCAAFALALVALHRFAERLLGSREAARRAVLYVAVFPFSVFMTRVYAESVFLLASVLAVSSAYGQRWWRAGLFGACATLARPNGILIGLPLVLVAVSDRQGIRQLSMRAAALSPVPLALAAFCGFVYLEAGQPFAWLSAQGHWGYFLWNPPWQQLLKLLGRLTKYGPYDYFFVSPMAPFHFFNGLAALVFLALTPAVFKRLGAPMGSYVLVSLLIPLSSNSLVGIGRYAAVLFPVFMLLGGVRSSRAHEALIITGSLLLALYVTFFVTQQPIY